MLILSATISELSFVSPSEFDLSHFNYFRCFICLSLQVCALPWTILASTRMPLSISFTSLLKLTCIAWLSLAQYLTSGTKYIHKLIPGTMVQCLSEARPSTLKRMMLSAWQSTVVVRGYEISWANMVPLKHYLSVYILMFRIMESFQELADMRQGLL